MAAVLFIRICYKTMKFALLVTLASRKQDAIAAYTTQYACTDWHCKVGNTVAKFFLSFQPKWYLKLSQNSPTLARCKIAENFKVGP